jgi:hypothetical protein
MVGIRELIDAGLPLSSAELAFGAKPSRVSASSGVTGQIA